MTRTITIASTATGFATLLKGWGRMLAHRAPQEGTAAALPLRLAHDSGLSDLRPAAGEGSAPTANPLAREMMRRSF